MERKTYGAIIVALVIVLLLPELANADRLRWRSRVRNFPSQWCLIEGRSPEELLTFTADSPSARITFTADATPDQQLDNIYVVERGIYESFLIDPLLENANVQCQSPSHARVYNFQATGSTEVFLEQFDFGASGWELNGALWVAESAPRNPVGIAEAAGGSIRFDSGSSAAVTVMGLQPGREYVVGGWWSTNYEGLVLTVDVDTEPEGGLFLRGGRFKVEATWSTGPGNSGIAQGTPITDETGYLWFFSPQNVEVVLKVLDACGLNSRYWVFIAGLTDVQVDLKVTDTLSGASKTYRNPRGVRFQPVQDTNAFATCP